MRVHIVSGNEKIGTAMNVSLRPGKDCGNCSGCARDCYDRKFYRMYPNVRHARDENAVLAREHRGEYFTQIETEVETRCPEYFRWHVGGDILDQDYLDQMITLAEDNPDTRFLAYTKMYWLDFGGLPENLVVMFSGWPGMPMGRTRRPVFRVLEDEAEVPADAFQCPGECGDCRACWHAVDGEVIYHVIHP